MASDSLCVDNGTRSRGDKIFEVRGDLLGVAGDYNQAKVFVAWYRDKRKRKPDVKADIEILVLTKKGELVLWTSELIPDVLKADFWAIGTGRDVALGIMHDGGTPERAVEIACLVDVNSGLPVVVYERAAK